MCYILEQTCVLMGIHVFMTVRTELCTYKQLGPRRYCNRISLIIRTILLFTCIKHVFTDIRVNVLSLKS